MQPVAPCPAGLLLALPPEGYLKAGVGGDAARAAGTGKGPAQRRHTHTDRAPYGFAGSLQGACCVCMCACVRVGTKAARVHHGLAGSPPVFLLWIL
eukprot:scaffold163844_cov15-Tisochrysis_lutea.AAC.1